MTGWTYDEDIDDIREMTPVEAWDNEKARAAAKREKVEPVKPCSKIPHGMFVTRRKFEENDTAIMPAGYGRAMAVDTAIKRTEKGTLTNG